MSCRREAPPAEIGDGRNRWSSPSSILAAITCGLTTVVMVLMLGQSRVLFAMSRDGLLPTQLAKTGRHGTPVRITVLVAVLVAIVACVWLMLNSTGLTWVRFGIWMLVGVAVYVLYGRSHSLQGRRQANEVSGAT